MTLQAIYDLAVKLAIEHDPRGQTIARDEMRRYKAEYEKLPNHITIKSISKTPILIVVFCTHPVLIIK